jgi:hypothetical protein
MAAPCGNQAGNGIAQGIKTRPRRGKPNWSFPDYPPLIATVAERINPSSDSRKLSTAPT